MLFQQWKPPVFVDSLGKHTVTCMSQFFNLDVIILNTVLSNIVALSPCCSQCHIICHLDHKPLKFRHLLLKAKFLQAVMQPLSL
jgi:hypothetical protein